MNDAGAKSLMVGAAAVVLWLCGYALGSVIGRSQMCATICGEHYVVEGTTCVCLEVVP